MHRPGGTIIFYLVIEENGQFRWYKGGKEGLRTTEEEIKHYARNATWSFQLLDGEFEDEEI